MRQLQPDFGEDLTVKEGGYEVILGSQSNYLIRVRDYEVDPAFFADYPYDRAPETTDPQTLMQARVIFDTSGLKTQSIGEDISQFFSNIFNFAADQLDEFDEYNKERRAKNLERIGKITQPSDTLVIPTAGLSAPSLAVSLDEYMVGKSEALTLILKYHDVVLDESARRLSRYDKQQWAALPLFARNGLKSAIQELSYVILPESVIDVIPLGKSTKIAKQAIPKLRRTIDLFETAGADILKSDAYKAATKLEKEKADKMVQLMHQIADELREHIDDINNNCGSGCDVSVRFYYELFRDSYISLGDYLLYKPLKDHRKFLTTYFDLKDLDVYFSKDNVPDFSVLHRIVNGQRVRLSGDDLKHYMKKEVEITLSTETPVKKARDEDMKSARNALLNQPEFVAELRRKFPDLEPDEAISEFFDNYVGHHGPFTSSDRTKIKFQFVHRDIHRPFQHKGTVHKE